MRGGETTLLRWGLKSNSKEKERHECVEEYCVLEERITLDCSSR